MKHTLFTLTALSTLVAAAGAQTKAGAPVKLDLGGYFPPPAGSSTLLVGGSNDCSTASTMDAISGAGTFAVTTVGATNGTPDATGCVNTQLDVWFYWTATASGPTVLATCGGVTADSVVTVWADNATPGLCPTGTTAIVCNDDFCGLQSQVTFNAVAGTSYFFQLGGYGTTATYSGTFTVGAPPPPPTNDSCATPIVLSGPGSTAVNTTAATTGTEGQAEAICLFFATTAINKDVWYTWTPTMTGTATVTTCPVAVDSKVAVYDGAGCPTTAAIACNDDNALACPGGFTLSSTLSFPTVCGQTYTIQLGTYSVVGNFVGSFVISETGSSCSVPPVSYCFGDGTGTACPCGNSGTAGNGCANSIVAAGGNLAVTGNASIASDTLSLNGSGMPNSSALYFQGTTQVNGGLGVPFGDGLRCAGGSVTRLGTKTNASNASSYPVGADLSVSVRGGVTAPGTRTYQVWYRNAAAFCTTDTFNLTNATQVTWY